MREDEYGAPCPSTLGEYLDKVQQLAPRSRAVTVLEEKIKTSPNGRDTVVKRPDVDVRAYLLPLMGEVVT